VIVSDYGRLQALGNLAGTPSWVVNSNTMADQLTGSAQRYFYSKLVPIPYGVYSLEAESPSFDNSTYGCYDTSYYHTWRSAPDTAKFSWWGSFDRDGFSGRHPSQFILGRHELSRSYYAYPPKEITDPMFRSTRQGGLGMQQHRFAWEQYQKVHGAPPTDIGECH
jgi:hypothetical protein